MRWRDSDLGRRSADRRQRAGFSLKLKTGSFDRSPAARAPAAGEGTAGGSQNVATRWRGHAAGENVSRFGLPGQWDVMDFHCPVRIGLLRGRDDTDVDAAL